ncbi:MBL fold metallo-hydrolase [Variovorax sp. J22R133]|uniref:MBL fold metallo-hydrolase n=1 Tax=Variovorax brevis TaxID=3053503 RepID=UPI0025760890|nr:MBL fold metallo-hydrolase [Variovorax sp. J22R133]MDM0115148.1 MBL fold metallo-hydrolase [Variovorax sp. J22R133]
MRLLLASTVLAIAACGNTGGHCESPFAASPQFKGCTFHNIPNPDARPTENAMKIWSRFVFGTKTATEPVDRIPVRPLTTAQLESLDPKANHVVRIGHSTTLLKLGGRYWLTDPMFSERASPFSFMGPKRFHAPPIGLQQLPPIDGVIVSHDHYDHLDEASIAFLATRAQRFFVPLGLGQRLVDMGVPRERITELDWWQSARLGEVQITSTPSQHFSGRTLSDRDSTLWTSWVIDGGGQRIFYSGDSGYSASFRSIGDRLGPFDLAMIENGEYDAWWPSVHMTPAETVQASQDLRARLLLPVHNSTFDLAFHTWHAPLDGIAEQAAAKKVDLATPEFGEVVTIGQARSNVRWWVGLK